MKSPSPDDCADLPRFIVTARRCVLGELVAAIMQGTPLLALTGPPGSGKTTLASALHEELLSRSVHVLRAGRGESHGIDLRALAGQLLDKAEPDFDADDIEALFDVMTTRSAPDQKVVLIIDNAELLRADALGYLRLLSSIAMDAMPQIVFIGDPSFWDEGEHPARSDIRESITDRRELELLSEAETRAFAELAMPPAAFGEGTLEALVRHGNGVIGRIAWLLALAKTLNGDWRLEALSPAAIDTAAARLSAAAAPEPEGEPADAPPETAAIAVDPIGAVEPARRRLGLAPRLGLALGMVAIGVVGYWQAAWVHGERMVALASSVLVAGGLTPPLHQTQTAAVPAARAVAGPPVPADDPVAAVEPPLQPTPVQPPPARPSWLLADVLDRAVAGDPAADIAPGAASPVEAPVQPAVAAADAVAANGEEILPGPGDVAASQEPTPAAAARADNATPDTPAAAEPAPDDGRSPQGPVAATVKASQGSAMTEEPAAAPGPTAIGPPDAILPGPGDVAASQEPNLPATAPASAPVPGDVSSPQTRSPAPAADVMPLLSRGNAMLALGDIAAARLFYERAASLGSAQGAVSLGKTYDPGFLAAIRAAGVTPDRDAAATWYRKGAALGDTEGSHLLVTLTAGR